MSPLNLSKSNVEKELENLKLALDQSSIVAFTDKSGTIVHANDKFCEISQYSREELLGQNHRILNSGKHPKEFFIQVWKTISSGKVWQGEIQNKTKNGSYYWVFTTIVPLLGDDGKPNQYIAIRHDITEHKKAEEERLRLAANTHAAMEADRLKSEFLANMSHEIRTPLNGILGMTRLVLDTALNNEQRDSLLTVIRSGENLLTVINDILDFSKVEAGKLDLELINFAIRPLLSDIEMTMSLAAISKNVSFVIEIDPTVGSAFKGDPGRLRQVLTNLIGNAIKFTGEGQIKITVSQTDISNQLKQLRFEVDDTGIGIPTEALSRMFQSFSQADSSTSRRFGGTGLGLSISRRLVELMGGKIGVESVLGKGSKFWFILDLPVGEVCENLLESSSQKKVQTSFPARILIAEDNPINQMVAMATLKNLGYRPHTVANGVEVLNALREVSYDLILMDCQMPELDGYETTIEIRKNSSLNCQNIPIIAMTANALKGDLEKCLSVGMDDYISKPFQPSALHEIIEKQLRQKKRAETKTTSELWPEFQIETSRL